ncbi:MAG TPA: secretin N-terminal domain-containing protein [Thermoguttaceae bacterium]|nr:secretin N-terminal domain-containing protein [Thermoguttaceae bacterium]
MNAISAVKTFVAALTVACPLFLAGMPAAAQQDNAASTEPLLRAYPCPAIALQPTVARLRSEFQGIPGVAVAADARTGQILVQAPPEIQVQIAQRLQTGAPVTQIPPTPTAQPPSSPTPAAAAAGVSQSRSVQLRNNTAAQVEAALLGMLGDRLAPVPGGGFGIKSYRMALTAGSDIQIGIHEQANLVILQGTGSAVDSCVRLIQVLDGPHPTLDQTTRLASFRAASPASVRKAVQAIGTEAAASRPRGPMVTMLFQQPAGEPPLVPGVEPPLPPDFEPPVPLPPENGPLDEPPFLPEDGAPEAENGEERSLIGPVQVELLEDLGIVVVRGHPRDVEQVMAILDEIERLSAETEPEIRVYQLAHVDSEALAALITPLYGEVFTPRRGSVSITALVKPNALLLIGRIESVQTVVDLIRRLDRPVAPASQFRVFRLRFAAAATAQAMLAEFFAERPGLGTRVLATADFRSNSLIVRAAPRDMAEVAGVIEQLDISTSATVNEMRVFKLENALAEDLAPILQYSINGQAAAGVGQAGGAAGAGMEPKSTMLQFLTVDTKGQRRLESGILTDVRINADARANALLVTAPTDCMELLGALIQQLDKLPAIEAQIKVFTIVNSDALSLIDMLESLFGQQTTTAMPVVQTAAAQGESSLVPLRFAVDVRTNSIIASGTMGDLKVVEAILLRLDSDDVRNRISIVYRLKNSPAVDVANAINQFLTSERQVQQISPGLLSPFEQIEREVVVVPEPVSNSLIVSATARFFQEIRELVEQLDERPPMVMIQVLIAEVALNDTDEFGVELGLQDSILFDRSILGDIITTTVSESDPATGIVTSTDTIRSATITPGYGFNNQPSGNSGSTQSLNGSSILGPQGLSNFALGRVNNELGFGGLVLSASNESVSILVRALKECRRLEVLSRPQIMTLDNQPAFIQVGQRVPTIRGTQMNEAGQINNIEYENVGLIMGVTPRISPDGLVVMEIDAEKSQLGPIEEGIPISISATGEVIRSPRIDTTTAQTTVSALDGQTVVLGGLISKSKSDIQRKVPYLGDVPILGNLFRYDASVTKRIELLIIMTPHIVSTEEDAERIKQDEAARMHWCLCDVLDLAGDVGLRGRADDWADSETQVIYPDLEPDGRMIVEPEGPRIAPTPSPRQDPFQLEGAPASGNPRLYPTPAPRPAPSGTDPARTRPLSPNPPLQLHPTDQSSYRQQRYPGGVEQAVYHGGVAPAGPYGADPAANPSMYQTIPQYGRPPAVQPVGYDWPANRPPVQPIEYQQPVQYPPAQYTQPAGPGTPLYR